MYKLIHKNYILSCQEAMVLAAWSGINKLHMLCGEPLEEMDERELRLTLFQLYQKGVLCWEDPHFRMKPELELMFQDLRRARTELQIYSERRKSPLLCFGDDDMVVMEMGENEKDTICLHSQVRKDFLEELRDRQILPSRDSRAYGSQAKEENRALMRRFRESCPSFWSGNQIQYEALKEALQEREELTACIGVTDLEEERGRGVILILDFGVFDGIIWLGEDSCSEDYFTLENLAHFLKEG